MLLRPRSALAVALALGALTSGCAAHAHFTRTTTAQAAPREPTCAFEVFTTRPDRPYDELGVIEDPKREGWRSISRVSDFIDVSRQSVCEAGGDAVLAEVNGMGIYVRGTVIRFRQQGTVTPAQAESQP